MRLIILASLALASCDRSPPVPSAVENEDLDAAAGDLENAASALNGIDDHGAYLPDTERAAPEGTAPSGQGDPEPSATAR